MQKPNKELFKEIVITADVEGSRQSPAGSTETQFARKNSRIILPPIESHWQFLPHHLLKDYEGGSIESRNKFRRMLSYPFKVRDSFKLRKSQSTKGVLEEVRNSKDQELVDSFREMLLHEGRQSQGKHYDYHTLLRFLRMRDFDLMKAKEMFLNYLKWREEYGVDMIGKEFSFDEYSEVKRCYPHGFHGVDRYGRPVYIERVGMVDVNALLQITTIERFVKHHVSEQERTLNWRYPACSLAAKKHIASTTSILDVKDVGASNFSKPARYIFMEIQKIDSNYYPETLNQLFIVNAGSAFKVLWTAIRAFLEPRTLAKIKVLGTNYLSNLVEVIDPSNLPAFFGGSCTCPDTGGCLFSDKGPWNDPEITELLQAMPAASEDERQAPATIIRKGTSFPNDPPTQRIEAFEALLRDAKTKFEKLESALEDTKQVLQGLTDHMKELQRNS